MFGGYGDMEFCNHHGVRYSWRHNNIFVYGATVGFIFVRAVKRAWTGSQQTRKLYRPREEKNSCRDSPFSSTYWKNIVPLCQSVLVEYVASRKRNGGVLEDTFAALCLVTILI